MNIEQDPRFADLPALDKMRKVRREVLKTINEYRKKFKAEPLNIDEYTNQAADEYDYYLL